MTLNDAMKHGHAGGRYRRLWRGDPADPWWYVWLPRAVYGVIVFAWVSLVLWALAPLIGWWLR